jgi:hypothetical protein
VSKDDEAYERFKAMCKRLNVPAMERWAWEKFTNGISSTPNNIDAILRNGKKVKDKLNDH